MTEERDGMTGGVGVPNQATLFARSEIVVSPHKEPVKVRFHWARSDKAHSQDTEIVLKSGVTSYQVHDDWELGPSGGKAKGHVWEQLCVKAPSGKNSNLVVADFEWAK